MKILLILFIVAGIFLIPSSFFDAYGLSCAPPKLSNSVEETDIVFSGNAISVENTLNYNGQLVPTKTLFSVTEHFKGIYEKEVTVHSDETWGPWFEEGKEYLIFADSHNGSIQAQLCSPIDLVENSDIELVRELSKNHAISPVKQIQMGVLPEEIICWNNNKLIFQYDGSPACVKPKSISKLMERGWGVLSLEEIKKIWIERIDTQCSDPWDNKALYDDYIEFNPKSDPTSLEYAYESIRYVIERYFDQRNIIIFDLKLVENAEPPDVCEGCGCNSGGHLWQIQISESSIEKLEPSLKASIDKD